MNPDQPERPAKTLVSPAPALPRWHELPMEEQNRLLEECKTPEEEVQLLMRHGSSRFSAERAVFVGLDRVFVDG